MEAAIGPVIFCKTPVEWETWLAKHHEQPESIWVKFAKKASGLQTMTYDEALDIALCYGWIDAQLKPFDKTYYLQKFSPRRAKSVWSKRNVSKVDKLIKAGKMKPAGLAQVEAAKKDGRWAQAYDSSANIQVPDDFAAALAHNPKAKSFFENLNKTNRYAVLWRIQTARKPETRQARIVKLTDMLNRGEMFH
ncbi:MAG TPA: YdeI/OmpD-associated family protein [Candidatus Saccharimonadales bacterium]|nr:YdeI/OmpD-associated family protein [Candidatus Saccharimonadales bacterium]